MKNLCIIPARSGSKGVPGKNTKALNGKKLLEYTYEAALSSKLIDNTILSTDSEIIAESAYPYRIEVPFIRPPHLAKDDTPTLPVIKHVIDYFEKLGEQYDNIVLLQPTCPFRERGFVDKCIEHFIATQADSLCSVRKVPHEYNPHWVFETDDAGFLKVATGDEAVIPSRQLLPPAFARDGSVYVFKADNISKYNSIYGKKMAYLESENLLHINIDTREDWAKAEMMAHILCSVN
jgi:CMP-N,N'-diacetyllegionaminic acid synthase